jgi:hypothetical protein
MKSVHVTSTPTPRYRILKTVIKMIILIAFLVGAYHVGETDQAKTDAEIATRHNLAVRTALLATNESVKPVHFPEFGVSVNGFEGDVVTDTWGMDMKLAREER